MKIIVKKTIECSEAELLDMNNLFNTIFDRERTVEEMLHIYKNNPLGYSYHSIFYEDGNIVGMNVYVPYYYNIEGEKVLMVNSIDSMILKKHRDFFNFLDMVNSAYDFLKSEGVVAVYGFPNDNAYPIATKSGLMHEVGRMHTYCLPIRIGGINKKFRILNWASGLFSRLWLECAWLFSSDKIYSCRIEKDYSSFNSSRYLNEEAGYKIYDNFVYRIMNFEGIRVAFLIDVFYKSPKNFCDAVKFIHKNERDRFDILLYPGYLDFKRTGMIKIPHKFEPKRFSLCVKVLDKRYKNKDLWKIENWDTNLSIFDLV